MTEQTDQQMRIAFAHDALGRVVQEVAAPDSAFEAAVKLGLFVVSERALPDPNRRFRA